MANEFFAQVFITGSRQNNEIDEIFNIIINSSPFKGCDITKDDNSISCAFTGDWTAEDNWDWLSQQLKEVSSELSISAREYLIDSTIDGYAYEIGTKYREKIYKNKNEQVLYKQIANVGLLHLLEILEYHSGAFKLHLEGKVDVGNGCTISRSILEKDLSEKYTCKEFNDAAELYAFDISTQEGDCQIILCLVDFGDDEYDYDVVHFTHIDFDESKLEYSEGLDPEEFEPMIAIVDELACDYPDYYGESEEIM